MGGSNWLGAVAFVNAALELCEQIADAGLPVPDRVYVANGTMGTAAGLALGLALGGMEANEHGGGVELEPRVGLEDHPGSKVGEFASARRGVPLIFLSRGGECDEEG